MKKRLAIVTLYSNAAQFYAKLIRMLFDDLVSVKEYCFEDGSIEKGIDADLIMISSYSIFGAVKKYVVNDSEIIISNRTLTKRAYNKLKNLNPGTKAMLVNASAEVSLETISLIYQFGLKSLELVPVHPNMMNIPNLDIAITPGEAKYVPKYVKQIIDIGDRVLDISTIVNVAVKLGVDYILSDEKFRQYFKEMIPIDYGLEKIMGKTDLLETTITNMLKILDEGIISINNQGIITSYNESAKKIIGYDKENVIGSYAKDILPEIPYDTVLRTSKSIKEKLVKINGVDIVVNISTIENMNTIYGTVVTIKRFIDIEKKQHKLRSQLIGKGHKAKYTFEDIKGTSKVINNTKEISKRMAISQSSVLIIGESGTGKELFAQAIHNYSIRKSYQFVAVNCAALPESLLESELFGYEGGAFTGAKRGGKLGLFELAHNGTLFLDEIGEMPVKLQARLLRVLQEKEVMRIGGDSLIKIDVRIIAATNRDLKELVSKGQFRKDLYYRLNVLPLKIPPLRDRKEDIFILTDEFKKEYGFDFELTEEAKKLFLMHYWEGNIRELRNYVEYFGYLNKKVIEVIDIPFNFSEDESYSEIDSNKKVVIERFKKCVGHKLPSYLYVLEKLQESYINKTRIGRRSIANLASKDGLYISEQEVRRILLDLQEYSMVKITKGRGGTKITTFGLQALKGLKTG